MKMHSPPVFNGGGQYISICYFLCKFSTLFILMSQHPDLCLLLSCYSRKMPFLWLEMHLKGSYSHVRASLARCHNWQGTWSVLCPPQNLQGFSNLFFTLFFQSHCLLFSFSSKENTSAKHCPLSYRPAGSGDRCKMKSRMRTK